MIYIMLIRWSELLSPTLFCLRLRSALPRGLTVAGSELSDPTLAPSRLRCTIELMMK